MTEPALADLVAINAKSPQAVRWAFKKMLLMERNPEAGEPLRGGLMGYRRLTISDNTWRIVWRVTYDDEGDRVVDIAEVWAIGARSDAEVYAEMDARVDQLPVSPRTVALADAVRRLGRAFSDIEVTEEPEREPLPDWLISRLRYQAEVPENEIHELTLKDAVDLWTMWSSRQADR